MSQKNTRVAYYTPGSNANILSIRREGDYNRDNHGQGQIEDIDFPASLGFHAVKSYKKHCVNPISAAEKDLLGRAIALLRFYAPEDSEPSPAGYGHEEWAEAQALLEQCEG